MTVYARMHIVELYVKSVHCPARRGSAKRLNDEEKEILEKFTECTNEMYSIAEREAELWYEQKGEWVPADL